MNLTAEQRIERAHVRLMQSPRFCQFAGVFMVGKITVSDKHPTAYTNGRDVGYGRAFVESLSEKALGFLIVHEAMHKAYRHMTIWSDIAKIDSRLTNCAMDYVINLQIRDADPYEEDVSMPRDENGELLGLYDERFRGMDTKQVFNILMEEGGGGGSDEPDNGDPEFDDHDWDGARDMTPEEKKELEREIDQAIRQGLIAHQKNIGKGGGNLDRELEDLLTPKIDWREVLREFVKATCKAKDTSSWRRVNRRFLSTGTYMPSMIGEKVGHIVIGVDTSGSIGGRELAEFLSEVKGIAEEVNPEKVDLLYWDSEVAAHETYDEGTVSTITESTKPRGGGGTSPSCVSTYLKENKIEPECTIMLTDGYVGSDWGTEWPSQVLWCIVGGNDTVAPNGKTIHIKD